MSRELLVFGAKTFKIEIPDDAKVTFAPFSPPNRNDPGWSSSPKAAGTLRIYKGTGVKENGVMAVFSGVTSFRDTAIGYMEEVAREEGAVIWKSDENGYSREEKSKGSKTWVAPVLEAGEVFEEEEDVF